jgi:lysozyme
MSKTKTGVSVGAAAVLAVTVSFLPGWEGMDKVAKKDMIGTGHPITYCYGQTDEFGQVKVGTRFTKKECDEKLAESLPTYLKAIDKCIKVPLPVKTVSSLLDASYNAGPAAVCRSPMLAQMNQGNIRAGCAAFKGWYVRSAGKVRNGLIARRSGIGDGRKSERDLCLEGLNEPKSAWYSGFNADTMTPPVVAQKRIAEEKKVAEAKSWKRHFKWLWKDKS